MTTERTGYNEYLGEIVHGVVEADDPRMVGAWTQINNVHFAPSQEPDEGTVAIVKGTARIDNDAGAWVGTFTTFGGQPGGQEWYVMEGEGAYEGLSTVFRFHGEDGFEGVILPSDLPPLPGAIAAADPRTTPTLSGSFPVSDGRKLGIRCWGEGEPTIVLVGGHPSNGIADFEGQAFLGRSPSAPVSAPTPARGIPGAIRHRTSPGTLTMWTATSTNCWSPLASMARSSSSGDRSAG